MLVRKRDDVVGIRGDLALKTLAAAQEKGFQLTIVDGGSSAAFREAVKDKLKLPLSDEKERGMSGGRRQSFRETSCLSGVKAIVWTEPEKVSILQDCLSEAALPVLQGEADIVVPSRDDTAFSTYPEYQANYEKDANRVWNGILRRNGLLAEDAPDIDAWIGPRIIKNDPDILAPFLDKYEFEGRGESHYDKINPELWPDALFLPLVASLYKGRRVQSVPVPYRHPAEQTASEQDSPAFQAKRKEQFRTILVSTTHFIDYLNGRPKRLRPAA